MMARPAPRGSASKGLLFGLLVWLAFLALAQAERAAAQAPGDTYVVRAGDTLASIAANLDVSLEELAAANNLADVNAIEAGQILVVPANRPPGPTVSARPGDTIQAIAEREGLSAARLADLNRTAPTARLFPGQSIRLFRATPRRASALRFGAVQVVSVPSAIVQGQAGWLQAEVSRPLPLKADWNGTALGIRPLAIKGEEGAPISVTVWGAYVPTPASMEPGVFPLSLSYEARSGVIVTRTYPVLVQARDFTSQEIALPPDQSALLEPEIMQAERAYLLPVWTRTTTPIQWRRSLILPLPSSAPTTSPYGIRRSYNGGQHHAFHAGHDFAAPRGSPVVAAADGIVALAERLTVRGVSVILDHGAGLFTGYWHLQEALVEPDAKVRAGDAIGLVGTTGRSTGDHLHWELRIYGLAVDPIPFLDRPLLALSAEAEQASGQGRQE